MVESVGVATVGSVCVGVTGVPCVGLVVGWVV